MLHLHPDLVDMTQAENFVPLSVRMERDGQMLTPEGAVGFGWQMQDLQPAGAAGNAAAADADDGPRAGRARGARAGAAAAGRRAASRSPRSRRPRPTGMNDHTVPPAGSSGGGRSRDRADALPRRRAARDRCLSAGGTRAAPGAADAAALWAPHRVRGRVRASRLVRGPWLHRRHPGRARPRRQRGRRSGCSPTTWTMARPRSPGPPTCRARAARSACTASAIRAPTSSSRWPARARAAASGRTRLRPPWRRGAFATTGPTRAARSGSPAISAGRARWRPSRHGSPAMRLPSWRSPRLGRGTPVERRAAGPAGRAGALPRTTRTTPTGKLMIQPIGRRSRRQRGCATIRSTCRRCISAAGRTPCWTARSRPTLPSRARGSAPQRLVVGPWLHMPWGRTVGGLDLGRGGGLVHRRRATRVLRCASARHRRAAERGAAVRRRREGMAGLFRVAASPCRPRFISARAASRPPRPATARSTLKPGRQAATGSCTIPGGRRPRSAARSASRRDSRTAPRSTTAATLRSTPARHRRRRSISSAT